MIKENLDVKQLKVKKENAKQIFSGVNRIVYSFLLVVVSMILIYTIYNFNYIEIENIEDIVFYVFVFLVIGIYFLHNLPIFFDLKDRNEFEKNASLINPAEKKGYFLKVGTVVKRHFKDIKETSKKSNLLHDLLIKTEAYCTHWAVLGTTGSGKTVFLQFIMKQILEIGGGFIFVDGKGSKTMMKTIKAILRLFKRQKDLFILNLADPSRSNSINVFSMNKFQLTEMFNSLIETGEGDIWEKKGTTLSTSLLSFIVPMQRLGIALNPKTINKINNYKELRRYSYRSMNFTLLDEYLNAPIMIDICKMFERVIKNDKDKSFFNDFIKASDQEQIEFKTMPHDALVSFLSKEGNLLPEEIRDTESLECTTEKLMKKGKDNIDNFIASAISYFTKLTNIFVNEYGNIFNKSDYDFSFEDIILNHRILYIALPGTKSQSTTSIFAKFIQANIIGVYETLKATQPLTKPYTIFFDESNSYFVDLQGVANLPSQSREQRLSFFYIMQSDQGKIDAGKGLEKEQLFANINNYVILKTTSPELTKMMQEKFGKVKTLKQKDYYRLDGKETGGEVRELDEDEKPMFELQDLEKLAPGECYIKINDITYYAIGGYMEAPYYYQDKGTEEIQLQRRLSKSYNQI